MKRTHRIALLALLLALCSPALSRAESSSLLPFRKQKPAFYLKLHYYTPTGDYLRSLTSDFNQGSITLLSHTSLGFAYRQPIFRSFYIQPEVHYGIATDWQEAALKPNFFSGLTHAFNIRQYSFFDVPLYLGLRWQPITLFAARLYAGPLMQFSLFQKQFGIVGQYSLAGGIGLDLLNFFSIDLGYRVAMNEFTFIETSSTYFLALSLKL